MGKVTSASGWKRRATDIMMGRICELSLGSTGVLREARKGVRGEL